ncbi:NADPH-dependent FMN reductase [Pseudomonas sp. Pf153]|uniref:NADPH-dependent FMN reductase n=1 Tax=Pseudomonas sp. Pf153 TaxID=1699309 RepID=UPI00069F52F4|nr:NAD(P)H-dependent oxidoreductase [Pseudomonas sp. Pf153]
MNRHLVIIAGSQREGSQSLKVAEFLYRRIEELELFDSAEVIDLAHQRLPLWPQEDTQSIWNSLQSSLRKATALIVICPEWNGMACPALKNFFVYAGIEELGHKPALLVGVSAGVGGAYPISELRASSYKNCRIVYLPEHLIIRNVESVMEGDTPIGEEDKRMRKRVDWVLRMLGQYEAAFCSIRTAVTQVPGFSSGM